MLFPFQIWRQAVYASLDPLRSYLNRLVKEVLGALEKAYDLLYRSKLNVSQAVARIKDEVSIADVPEVQHILSFIADSKRGIISGPRTLR